LSFFAPAYGIAGEICNQVSIAHLSGIVDWQPAIIALSLNFEKQLAVFHQGDSRYCIPFSKYQKQAKI